jgi:sigma-B regulation protein RsbU (phosphoserine phosphatase)
MNEVDSLGGLLNAPIMSSLDLVIPRTIEVASPGAAATVSQAEARRRAFAGMRPVNLVDNPRVPVLMEMVGALSRAADQYAVHDAFAYGMSRLFGPSGYVSLSVRGLRPGEYKITGFLNDIGSGDDDDPLNVDPWRDWHKMPVYTGGFFGEIIGNAYPELVHNFFLKNDPVFGDRLAGFGSMMAIPLFDQGEPLNWSITLRREPEGISIKELEDAILRSNLGGATVKNVIVNRQLREANQYKEREIEQIARIQRALLPEKLPEIPGVRIAANYQTFDTAGGDMYDFVLLNQPIKGISDQPTESLGMLIADASGHGPAAAVVSAMLNAILYAYPSSAQGPGDVLRFANRHLAAKRLEGMFVTAFLAGYHPPTRTLGYACAGHNPPLLKNPGSGGEVRRIDDVGGVPLGVLDDVEYQTGRLVMQPGQTLVLYTDGIVEAMNPQREMFGVEGIERALHACSGEPDCVINSITTALREHEAGIRPADDQTIVAVKMD